MSNFVFATAYKQHHDNSKERKDGEGHERERDVAEFKEIALVIGVRYRLF